MLMHIFAAWPHTWRCVFNLLFLASALFAGYASASDVVRRSGAEVSQKSEGGRAWAHTGQHSSGLQKQVSVVATSGKISFWRNIRKELEEKRKDVGSSARGSELAEVAQRDAMWAVVAEVDGSYSRKFMCALEEGKTYSKEALLLQGQAAYSKANVATARECALMCAADSLAEQSPGFTACKSFTYNRTSQDCRFFNFAKQARSAWTEDTCCTSGPPCNLRSMRTEIRSHFVARLATHKLPRSPKQNSITKQHSIAKMDSTDRRKVVMESALVSDAGVRKDTGPPKMTQLAELKKKHANQAQLRDPAISNHNSLETADAGGSSAAAVAGAAAKAPEAASAPIQQSNPQPQSNHSSWFSRIFSFF
jgi:hypothetical protein